MGPINEDSYELQFMDWLAVNGWKLARGPEIAHDGSMPERSSHKDVVLAERFEDALGRINPGLPKDAIRKVRQALESPGETDLLKANKQIHRWMSEGFSVNVRDASGEEDTRLVWLVDFHNESNNDWLAVNQLSVQTDADAGTRRPDIVLFLNGLPIGVVELKNPSSEDADIRQAFEQLQTYKAQISRLFYYNAVLVIADGADARMGSLTADWERFSRWRSTDGFNLDPFGTFGFTQTLIDGLLNKGSLLDLIRHFSVFVDGPPSYKMLPAYHQFYAVKKAYSRALTASAEDGDGRGGVMWHTQGAGKSFEMACLAGMLATSTELKNPTVVVVTDRKNLDNQLFDTFNDAKALMRQQPEMADSRDDLREKIGTRVSGGVVFTTIQKFAPEDGEDSFPALTDRRNIFVFTDEAHRSQYGFKARIDKSNKYKVGYAQHLRDALPNATFIAFTGTPVEQADKDTRLVFGEEIDVYDMAQANEDGATVPIYYESRLVELDISDEAKKELDELAEDLIEDEEDDIQANLKKRWADLERIVGATPRLERIADDIVTHFEKRSMSPELQDGKAMCVGMSRNICVDLYNEIVKIRPEWHNDDHRKGAIKIVFHSSASDNEKLRPHAYTEPQKRDLENRFRDSKDELKIVIVRDMWLTGYDSPPCHTMYVDKPMKGHNLMQAIARVNRVFKDKPGGLVVDYIGIATELKEALATYTRGSKKAPSVEFIEEALGVFSEKIAVVRDLLHGCSMEGFKEKPHEVIPRVADFVLGIQDGKKRFADASTALSRAYALVNSQAAAFPHREEVTFYNAIKVMLTKSETTVVRQTDAEREAKISQALSKGIVPEGVVDIFSAAGLNRPNIGLLSDDFLREVRAMKEQNLAVEALSRLLKGEIRSKFKRNVVKNSQFSELLESALAKYRNRGIETAQLIEELIELAKKLNEQLVAGNPDGLSEEEISFYDALEGNETAVREMEHEDLVRLAQELTKKVRENVKVDWSVRESTQAALRVMVRDLLDKYGYPPDFSNQAIETVIKQAEALTEEWLETR
ncbi:type I restriction endonuclease subunit R [Pontimonas sp.]|nr:type I restriction endonuclease subunit R [Pontimonas sp.]